MPVPGPAWLAPDRTGKEARDPAGGRHAVVPPTEVAPPPTPCCWMALRRANRTDVRRCQPTARDSHRLMSKLLTLVTYVNIVPKVRLLRLLKIVCCARCFA